MRRPAVATGVAILVGLACGSPPASGAVPAGNLITNGGAETGAGSSDSTTTSPSSIPGWVTPAFHAFTEHTYAAPGNAGFPDSNVSAGIDGGAQFFAGGPKEGRFANSHETATQDVDVSDAGTEIGAGMVTANLSAALGGYATQGDNAMVTAAFLDANGAALRELQIGPVSPGDRNNSTVLVPRSASTAVPAGTVKVRVTITITKTDGAYNDGYADNVSLELSSPPPGATAPSADLSVTQSAQPSVPRAGTTFPLTLRASNAGPDPATGVTLHESLATGTTVVSYDARCSPARPDTPTATCPLGDIPSGGSQSVTLMLRRDFGPNILSTLNGTSATADPAQSDNVSTQTIELRPFVNSLRVTPAVLQLGTAAPGSARVMLKVSEDAQLELTLRRKGSVPCTKRPCPPGPRHATRQVHQGANTLLGLFAVPPGKKRHSRHPRPFENLQPGVYFLTAAATDARGNSYSSPKRATVRILPRQ